MARGNVFDPVRLDEVRDKLEICLTEYAEYDLGAFGGYGGCKSCRS